MPARPRHCASKKSFDVCSDGALNAPSKGGDLLARALELMPNSLKLETVLLMLGEGGETLQDRCRMRQSWFRQTRPLEKRRLFRGGSVCTAVAGRILFAGLAGKCRGRTEEGQYFLESGALEHTASGVG